MKVALLTLFMFISFFAGAKKDAPANIYNFKVAALNGKDIDFADFKGKKVLIVNVPWFASNDLQYAELDNLYKKYKGKLVVVGLLADDFGVAPGAGKLATQYRKKDYHVSFPISARMGIKGSNRSPVYLWLTEKKYNNLKDSEVKWNFQKYLINESGELVAVFDPKVRATDSRIINAIEN